MCGQKTGLSRLSLWLWAEKRAFFRGKNCGAVCGFLRNYFKCTDDCTDWHDVRHTVYYEEDWKENDSFDWNGCQRGCFHPDRNGWAECKKVVTANVLKRAGFGFGAATMFGLLQDSITYGQWLTNVKAMGMGNAASSFAMKVGSGIGTAALGWILGAGGFDIDPTGASAIASINVACIWVPVITCVIGVICLILFDLDSKYDKVLADLEQGRWKGSSNSMAG